MDDTLNRTDSATSRQAQSEGAVARRIEQRTAQLPSDTFLWAALTVMGASLVLHLSGKKHESLFVGDWAAPLLLLGVYNKIVKIVKVAGSDRAHA